MLKPRAGQQPERGPNLILVLLLSGLAILINLLPLNIVFGMHVLLGSSVAVMALLLWKGWAGLVIGAVASLSAWNAWGHPWGPFFLSGEMVWLSLAVNHWRQPDHNQIDGTIVLWDIAFWMLIAAPLIFVIPHQVLGVAVADERVVVLKQLLNGMISTTLGFIAFIALRLLVFPAHSEPITLRGLIAATILTSICLPILVLSIFTSQQLSDAIVATQFDSMRLIGGAAAVANLSEAEESATNQILLEGIGLRRALNEQRVYVSNPQLFRGLSKYKSVLGPYTRTGQSLELLIPEGREPLTTRWQAGYWVLTEHFDATGRRVPHAEASGSIEIVEGARSQISRMEQQAIGMLTIFTSVMLIGSLFSQWLGAAISREFRSIAKSLKSDKGAFDHSWSQVDASSVDSAPNQDAILPVLPLSRVGELRALLQEVNHRIRQVNVLTRQLRSANQKLSHSRDELVLLSITDSLTGCLNRRSLEQRLTEAINGCHSGGSEFSLMCFDIDHLKHINDSYGHHAGDQIICFVVSLIKGRLRKTDCFYRMGGDEFLILLADCSMAEACRLGTMCCELIAAAELPAEPAPPPQVTISVGIVTYAPNVDTLDGILQRVDEALYEAKSRGRNQVFTR